MFAIGVICVGLIDILLGWSDERPPLPTIPWRKGEAPEAKK